MSGLGRHWKSLLIAVAIPLIGTAVFPVVKNARETTWLEAVRTRLPGVDPKLLELPRVCAQYEHSGVLADLCSTETLLDGWTWLSRGTLALAVALPLAIWAAGRRCARDRRLLLRVFRPGLYVVNGVTALMLLAQSGILVAMLWYGAGRPVIVIFFIVLGALAGSAAMLRAMFAAAQPARVRVMGRFASRQEEPRIWDLVDRMAARGGAAPPDNLILGLEPMFFVTQTPVECREGLRPGRTLYISTPLCRLISPAELAAVLGHEMAHFHGEDTEFTLRFYPIYRGAANAIQALAAQAAANSRGSFALIPAIHLLGFFLSNFQEAEAAISRERELAADRAASQACGARDVATALARIVLHESAFGAVLGADWRALAPPGARVNASLLFVHVARQQYAAASWTEIEEQLSSRGMAHPTDSHPPLPDRLQALGFAAGDLRGDLDQVLPPEPAAALFDQLDRREEAITDEIRELVGNARAARNLTFGQLPE